MKLIDLQSYNLQYFLSLSAEEVQREYYPPNHDFRKQTTSLSIMHFPILVSAALLAAGIKDTDRVPFNSQQANINYFAAPITLCTKKRKIDVSDLKAAANEKINQDFIQRITGFIKSNQGKENEDFIAVGFSDTQALHHSHGIRVHLTKDSKDFYRIKILDSVNDGVSANEDSPTFEFLSAYLEKTIKDLHPAAKVEIRGQASSYQNANLCYDHTAFELVEYILKKMGRPQQFKVSEGKRDNYHTLREKLYACHEVKSENLNDRLAPLVAYIKESVMLDAKLNKVKGPEQPDMDTINLMIQMQAQDEKNGMPAIGATSQPRLFQQGQPSAQLLPLSNPVADSPATPLLAPLPRHAKQTNENSAEKPCCCLIL